MTDALDSLDRRTVPGRSTAVAILAISLILAACGAGTAMPAVTSVATPYSSVAPTTTAAPSPEITPAPPPAGRLAYGRRGADGQWSGFISNTDGTGEQALIGGGARWAPAGTRLTTGAMSPEGLFVTALVNPDGSDYVRFDAPDATLNIGCPAWSPDASRLACEAWDDTDPTRNGLYTVNASDGGDLTRVTSNPDGFHDIPGEYSPDGRQIAFTRHDPMHDPDYQKTTLMVVNVDGSGEHALTDRQMVGGSWSPDGTTILGDAIGMLWLVPVDGSQPTPIVIDEAPGGHASRGAWSPDGDWIVFSLNLKAASNMDIYVMRKDGTDLRQITDSPTEDEEFGDWGVAAP